jgi:hypothetical protein
VTHPNTAAPIIPDFPGAFPDAWDPRDHSYAEYVLTAPLVQPPTAFNLSAEMPGAYDQGHLGSCTAQAAVGSYAHLHHKLFNEWQTLSRMHNYWRNRMQIDPAWQCRDNGGSLRLAFKALTEGTCREELWPYDPRTICGPPGPACRKDAPHHQVLDYLNLDHRGLEGPGRGQPAQLALRDLFMHSIASGYPVGFTIALHHNFEAQRPDYLVPWPAGGFRVWHAMIAYGYNAERGDASVQNSWGRAWGWEGRCRLPLGWFLRDAIDLWTLRAVE